MPRFIKAILLLTAILLPASAPGEELPWIRISADQRGFVAGTDERPFVPWGFNYDHDAAGTLLEDYWQTDWSRVEKDFAEIRRLGANVVRIHLQLARFMAAADKPQADSLRCLRQLVKLAERERLYLDLTGLGCYHKQDVPEWYDQLDEQKRWDVQAAFWVAVAESVRDSPAVFCFDLMNEPIVPGGPRGDREWLGPAFAGKHFVQFISLEPRGRKRVEIARAWIQHLTSAIRHVDKRHLITVGLVDWSLDRLGLTSGFIPQSIAADLDFLAVHLYPESGKEDLALEKLKGFAVGKPVIVEETFPLRCSPAELASFIDHSREHAAGWISFYWGTPIDDLDASKSIAEAIQQDWLRRFSQGPTFNKDK